MDDNELFLSSKIMALFQGRVGESWWKIIKVFIILISVGRDGESLGE